MKIGTRSVLFGVHAFWVHPWIVLRAWFIVHRRRPSLAELMAIVTHDLGYLGMPNMDGKEGSNHPEIAASWWRGKFGEFGNEVAEIIIGHSRFHAVANNVELSALFQPDKLATALYPIWLYLILGNLSGEIKEYMSLRGTEKYPDHQPTAKTQTQWLIEVQGHMGLMGIQGEQYYIVMKQLKKDKIESVGYAKPETRGELRDKLQDGFACEVATHVSEMTEIILRSWFDFEAFTVRLSENAGWSVFEPTKQ